MKRIGIVGCGTIGATLAEAIEERFSRKAKVVSLSDLDEKKARELSKRLSSHPPVAEIDEAVSLSELIIEAASGEAAASVGRKAINAGKDIMVMSSGGLLKETGLFKLAEEKGVRIYIPSGALAGLDAVKAASVGKIKTATLTTRKPPLSLKGAPYLAEHGIDLDNIDEERVVFEGSAREAVKGFPKNINVSAALSFAGVGAEHTRVRIVTSPAYKTNSHEITLEGEFGKMSARTDNVPSPQNPKTSYLAVLSAIATLEGILSSVKVGT